MVNRCLVIGIYLSLLLPAAIQAQQRVTGVDWNVPKEQSKAVAQLHHFSDAGISYLQIDQKLEPSIWDTIDKLGFTVFGKLPIRFPMAQAFAKNGTVSGHKIQALIKQYEAHSSVQAIGVFAYGAKNDPAFQQAVQAFIKQSHLSKPIYYIAASPEPALTDTLFDFKILRLRNPVDVTALRRLNSGGNHYKRIGAYVYHPGQYEKQNLTPVKHLLQATVQTPQRPVFFPSSWLKNILPQYPDFTRTLSLYAASSHLTSPIPKRGGKNRSTANIITIALLIMWMLLALTYHFNPLYSKSFIRYYTSHKFYVNDVMEYHHHTGLANISILIQHALAGGIVFYCILQTAFSELGRQALYHYYPILAISGTGSAASFFWILAAILVIECVCIFWLWLASFRVSRPGQIIDLYSWPLQLSVFIATVISGIFLSGGSSLPIYILGAAFFLIFIVSYVAASKDIVQYLHSKQLLFFAGTAVLYVILLAALGEWIYSFPNIHQVIALATSLP